MLCCAGWVILISRVPVANNKGCPSWWWAGRVSSGFLCLLYWAIQRAHFSARNNQLKTINHAKWGRDETMEAKNKKTAKKKKRKMEAGVGVGKLGEEGEGGDQEKVSMKHLLKLYVFTNLVFL